jgi:hypothetical protein
MFVVKLTKNKWTSAMKLKILIMLFGFASLSHGRTPELQEDQTTPLNSKILGRYFHSSSGIGLMSYRDFATSPLYFSGLGLHLNLGWERVRANKEFLFSLQMQLGVVGANAPLSNYYQAFSVGFMSNYQGYTHLLWDIPIGENPKNSLSIGPGMVFTNNIRVVPNLNNNAFGGEGFFNLMATGIFRRDVSRKKPFNLDLGLFTLRLKPRSKSLSFQFGAGLLNLNRRPGYAYFFDGELDGTNTNPLSYIYENYKWRLNGWRMMSKLEYAWYLENGNGHSVAYLWDAVHAPGGFEAFQMASHMIRYTLIFKRKDR